MVFPTVSRGRCLGVRGIGVYESIPHRFLGRPDFAVKPTSMIIVGVKLRGKIELTHKISSRYSDSGKTLFQTLNSERLVIKA